MLWKSEQRMLKMQRLVAIHLMGPLYKVKSNKRQADTFKPIAFTVFLPDSYKASSEIYSCYSQHCRTHRSRPWKLLRTSIRVFLLEIRFSLQKRDLQYSIENDMRWKSRDTDSWFSCDNMFFCMLWKGHQWFPSCHGDPYSSLENMNSLHQTVPRVLKGSSTHLVYLRFLYEQLSSKWPCKLCQIDSIRFTTHRYFESLVAIFLLIIHRWDRSFMNILQLNLSIAWSNVRIKGSTRKSYFYSRHKHSWKETLKFVSSENSREQKELECFPRSILSFRKCRVAL